MLILCKYKILWSHNIWTNSHTENNSNLYDNKSSLYKNKSICIWKSFYGLVIICYTSENIQKFRKNTYLMDYSKYI